MEGKGCLNIRCGAGSSLVEFLVKIGQTSIDQTLATPCSPLKRDSSYGRCLAEDLS